MERYLRLWLVGTLAVFVGVAFLNLVVDPYRLFELVDVAGFNRIKSQASQYAQMSKRRGAERLRPNGLILGNSRAEIGFDPEHRAWPSEARPAFNLALPGTGAFGALDELRNASRMHPPRLVIVGVDFLDFRVAPGSASRARPRRADPFRVWREYGATLFTAQALVDSIATVKAQHERFPASLTDRGFNPMHDYAGIARREGYAALFLQRNREYARNWVQGAKSIYFPDGPVAPEYRAVEEMIDIARRGKFSLRFVVYPYHAQGLLLFDHAGLWPAFSSWKRELVKMIEDHGAGADIQLWDFSGFSPYAVESVPPMGDTRTELRWYWEAGHFKRALGDVMLTRMLVRSDETNEWGRRLVRDNLEPHLAEQQRGLEAYKLANAEETGRLAMLAASMIPASSRLPPEWSIKSNESRREGE